MQNSEDELAAKFPLTKLIHFGRSEPMPATQFEIARTLATPTARKMLEVRRQVLNEMKPGWLVEWEKYRRKRALDSWF